MNKVLTHYESSPPTNDINHRLRCIMQLPVGLCMVAQLPQRDKLTQAHFFTQTFQRNVWKEAPVTRLSDSKAGLCCALQWCCLLSLYRRNFIAWFATLPSLVRMSVVAFTRSGPSHFDRGSRTLLALGDSDG